MNSIFNADQEHCADTSDRTAPPHSSTAETKIIRAGWLPLTSRIADIHTPVMTSGTAEALRR